MSDEEDLKLLRSGSQDLSRCDFRGADLANIDFKGRDLTEAHLENAILTGASLRGAVLTGAQFTQADLSGADLEGTDLFRAGLVFANFSGANLKRANFNNPTKTTRHSLHNVKFDGADIRGANFRDVTFNEGCSFLNVEWDEQTNFDGASVLRSAARLPVFSRYIFDKGKLSLDPNSTSATSGDESSELKAGTSPETGNEALNAGQSVPAQSIVRAIAVAHALGEHLSQELKALSARIPNDPDSLSLHEQYVALLVHIAEQVNLVVSLLQESDSNDTTAVAIREQRALGVLNSLGNTIAQWARENAQATLKAGINLGGIAIGTLGLSALGVDPNISVSISGAIFGGSEVVSVLTAKKE